MINFVSASWLDRITGKATEIPRCIDSDEGISYAEKGSIKLTNEFSSGEEFDKCSGVGEGISEFVCGSDGCGYVIVYPTSERKNHKYSLVYDNGDCNVEAVSSGYSYDCSIEGKKCQNGKCVEDTPVNKCEELKNLIIEVINTDNDGSIICGDSNYNSIADINKDGVISPIDSLKVINNQDTTWCTTKLNDDSNPCQEGNVCSDGTIINECSENQPFYCVSLERDLIENCDLCGCPSEKKCNKLNNECYLPELKIGPKCQELKSLVLEILDKYGSQECGEEHYNKFEDINKDGAITPIDALQVTNNQNDEAWCTEKIKDETDPCEDLVCSDGTQPDSCSSEKPKYCEEGELVDNCEVCECEEDYKCIDKSCVKTTFCEEYYGGIEFDGFCFTDIDKTTPDYRMAKNGIFKYTPQNSYVERTIEYPISIKVVEVGISLSVKITLENKGDFEERVRLNDFRMYVYDTENIEFDEESILSSGEKIQIEVPINLPDSRARTGVDKYISFSDNGEGYILPRIILWDYNPFSEENVVGECGGRKFGENQGVCINDIFFPAIEGFSCSTDADCLNYLGFTTEKCFEHTCLYMEGDRMIASRDKEYKVGILPLYITNDDNQYNYMEGAVNNRLGEIIPKMENWFSNEKDYWGIDNDFFFDFYPLSGCRLTRDEYEGLIDGRATSETSLRNFESHCIANKDYDILIISLQNDQYFDGSFIGGGANLGFIMQSDLNPRTIFHELLHSFGQHDLYGVENYQWGNCYLYNVNTGGDWNEEMPHLCKFEAMQLGWMEKYHSEGESDTIQNNIVLNSEIIECKNGCILNNICVPIGVRKEGQYCDFDRKLNNQKEEDKVCENNFECISNVCINDNCVSGSLWERFLLWLKRLM